MIVLQFVYCDGLGGRLIRWFERSWPTHVDAVMPDGTLLGARSDRVGSKPAGVQARPPNYEKWSRVERINLRATLVQEQAWENWLLRQIGKPYDHLAILAFAFNRNWRDSGAWFCSEMQLRALEVSGWFRSAIPEQVSRLTPRDALLLTAPWSSA